MDDATVERSSKKEALAQNAYLIFYQNKRVKSETPPVSRATSPAIARFESDNGGAKSNKRFSDSLDEERSSERIKRQKETRENAAVAAAANHTSQSYLSKLSAQIFSIFGTGSAGDESVGGLS